MFATQRDTERFEAKFIPEPMSGCWLWLGATRLTGLAYGAFYLKGRREQAHRVSFAIYKCEGDMSALSGRLVLHSCDLPACVNPDHLDIGTQAENIQQAYRRGRLKKGALHHTNARPETRAAGHRHGNARLTVEQVRAILACQLPNNQIAKLVGVHRSVIGEIKRRKSWANIDAPEAKAA